MLDGDVEKLNISLAARGHADSRWKQLQNIRGKSKHRLLWAALLARTFHLDMETCRHCGGMMRIIAAVTDPASIKQYLKGDGLPSEIPEIKPARPPPQLDFEYDDLEYADG